MLNGKRIGEVRGIRVTQASSGMLADAVLLPRGLCSSTRDSPCARVNGRPDIALAASSVQGDRWGGGALGHHSTFILRSMNSHQDDRGCSFISSRPRGPDFITLAARRDGLSAQKAGPRGSCDAFIGNAP